MHGVARLATVIVSRARADRRAPEARADAGARNYAAVGLSHRWSLSPQPPIGLRRPALQRQNAAIVCGGGGGGVVGSQGGRMGLYMLVARSSLSHSPPPPPPKLIQRESMGRENSDGATLPPSRGAAHIFTHGARQNEKRTNNCQQLWGGCVRPKEEGG